jgi:hypothetical protein
MCGYPPLGAQVILNGHERVEREAVRMQTTVTKNGNCFIEGSDFNAINRLASGLNCASTIEHLSKHYLTLREELHRSFETIGLAA